MLPVDRIAIKYDMPMALARLLVGRTEAETEQNIELMEQYLAEREAEIKPPDYSELLNNWKAYKQQATKLRITNKIIAKAAGVTPTSVTNWLHGHTEPYPNNIEKLAAYFGVSVTEFLKGPNS